MIERERVTGGSQTVREDGKRNTEHIQPSTVMNCSSTPWKQPVVWDGTWRINNQTSITRTAVYDVSNSFLTIRLNPKHGD